MSFTVLEKDAIYLLIYFGSWWEMDEDTRKKSEEMFDLHGTFFNLFHMYMDIYNIYNGHWGWAELVCTVWGCGLFLLLFLLFSFFKGLCPVYGWLCVICWENLNKILLKKWKKKKMLGGKSNVTSVSPSFRGLVFFTFSHWLLFLRIKTKFFW